MKERPILFSGPMVRAILEGRKTQTRRVVKPQPEYIEWFEHQKGWCGGFGPDAGSGSNPVRMIQCPYGKPGDRLWVRETWQSFGDSSSIRPRVPHSCQVRYDATGTTAWCKVPKGARGVYPAMFRSRPSIHMPRWASRITLEVVSVRVERLQEISEADAEAEGVAFMREYPDADETLSARQLYDILWESINGAGSWAANPWVWVVEFRKVEGGVA